jgi:flavin-dependent dehydrogenase
LRPGIRARYEDGIFAAGNAAGEAHPAVAEGISMALQSAWLLTCSLLSRPAVRRAEAARRAAGEEYAAAWLSAFAPRLRWSAAVAHWAMRPRAAGACVPLLRRFPALLAAAARWSGKARVVAH